MHTDFALCLSRLLTHAFLTLSLLGLAQTTSLDKVPGPSSSQDHSFYHKSCIIPPRIPQCGSLRWAEGPAGQEWYFREHWRLWLQCLTAGDTGTWRDGMSPAFPLLRRAALGTVPSGLLAPCVPAQDPAGWPASELSASRSVN